MNYAKHYNLLIDKFKVMNRNEIDGYVESHHIIPVFMFKHNKRGSTIVGDIEGDHDSVSNLVNLPLREHLVAHALLAKMYQGTKYENAAASALCFFFSKGMGLKHPRSSMYKPGMAKKYAWMKAKGQTAISVSRKGMMPAKDIITGKIVGSVAVNDPRVIAGELVHHSKGRKASEETRSKCSKPGMANGNAKRDITEADIFKVVKLAIRANGRIIASEFWKMLQSELNCTAGLISSRYGGFLQLIDAYRKAGNEVLYDSYFREDKEKYASTIKRKWITNGIDNAQHPQDIELPEGWYLGRTIRKL